MSCSPPPHDMALRKKQHFPDTHYPTSPPSNNMFTPALAIICSTDFNHAIDNSSSSNHSSSSPHIPAHSILSSLHLNQVSNSFQHTVGQSFCLHSSVFSHKPSASNPLHVVALEFCVPAIGHMMHSFLALRSRLAVSLRQRTRALSRDRHGLFLLAMSSLTLMSSSVAAIRGWRSCERFTMMMSVRAFINAWRNASG